MRASTLVALSSFSLVAFGCTKVTEVTHTYYGYPDNDPPGPAIAYDCGRGYKAGGTGTYSDPLTFASAPGEFTQCEIIYDPYTKKYLRFEDYCAQCNTDWTGSQRTWHIDLWTGSTTVNGGDEQIQCENDLTPNPKSQTIVRQPRNDLPVDSTKLYVKGGSPACRTTHIYPTYNIADYC